jgi:hypothetical protein
MSHSGRVTYARGVRNAVQLSALFIKKKIPKFHQQHSPSNMKTSLTLLLSAVALPATMVRCFKTATV